MRINLLESSIYSRHGQFLRDLMESRGTCMHLKVSELASRYRFSVDAIYAWVRAGLIPHSCTVRIGNSIRIDSEKFDQLLHAGKLYRPRRRHAEAQARHSCDTTSAAGFSEDQHTTRFANGHYHHRFMSETEAVSDNHPYGPGPAESISVSD